MTIYSAQFQDGLSTRNLSKKKISEIVYLKIANSLLEYNLKGKKFDSKLKKISKLLAKDIAKANKDQKKSNVEKEISLE